MFIRGREEGVMEDDSRSRYAVVEFMRYDSSADRSEGSDISNNREGDGSAL